MISLLIRQIAFGFLLSDMDFKIMHLVLNIIKGDHLRLMMELILIDERR